VPVLLPATGTALVPVASGAELVPAAGGVVF
jgi:hypothetical protein